MKKHKRKDQRAHLFGVQHTGSENDWNYETIHNYIVEEIEAYRDEFDNTYFKHKDNYYDNLIKHKVIENNKIYDLNDSKFVKKIGQVQTFCAIAFFR